MSENKSKESSSPRKRSLTSMTLSWIADRMRKAERIKSALATGEYRVDSEELARSIVVKVP